MTSRRFRCIPIMAMVIALPAALVAEAYFAAASGYWTNAAAWHNSVPPAGQKTYIGHGSYAPDATCVFDTPGQTTVQLTIGRTSASRGVLNITGGDLTTSSGYIYIGHEGTGVVNMTSGRLNCGSQYLRIAETASGRGTLNLSGDGVMTNVANTFVGFAGTGTLNLGGNARFMKGINGVYIANNNGSTGVVNVTGGLWNNNGQRIDIAELAGSVGTINLTGGILTNWNQVYVGYTGTGTLNLGGDAVLFKNTAGNNAYIGNGAGSKGTVNQTGGIWNNGGQRLYVGNNATAVALYEISGGALTNVSNLYVPYDGVGTFSVVGSRASIFVGSYTYSAAGSTSTLRVKPDAGGLSPINVSGSVMIKGALEVDFSNYRGTDPITIIDYNGTRNGSFSPVTILTAGWSADVEYKDGTVDTIRLVNIVSPIKRGTVVLLR